MNATLRLRRDELAKHRERAGLTTEQRLADAMGASQATVNKVITGKANPGPQFIASLVSALNDDVTFYDLWEIVPTGAGEQE